jgi:hypothetical protein
MSAEHHGIDLLPVITLLSAAVIAAPLAKRLGLGAVLGYLAAGLVIGPFGFGVFTEPASILHVAELGVVMFLFVIGLEMRPSRLWAMRHQIFGLGFVQGGRVLDPADGSRRVHRIPGGPFVRSGGRASCSPPPPSSCSCWKNAAIWPPTMGSAWWRFFCSKT